MYTAKSEKSGRKRYCKKEWWSDISAVLLDWWTNDFFFIALLQGCTCVRDHVCAISPTHQYPVAIRSSVLVFEFVVHGKGTVDYAWDEIGQKIN